MGRRRAVPLVRQARALDGIARHAITTLARRAESLVTRLNAIEAQPHSIALGVAIGVFAAFIPILGIQLGLAAAAAWLLGANVVAALLGTFIGNPLTWPMMWLASYKLGAALLSRDMSTEPVIILRQLGASLALMSPEALSEGGRALLPILAVMTVGAIPVGLLVAVMAYALARRVLRSRAGR